MGGPTHDDHIPALVDCIVHFRHIHATSIHTNFLDGLQVLQGTCVVEKEEGKQRRGLSDRDG